MGENSSTTDYVCLEGPPYERGRHHGRMRRAEIRELMALWRRHVETGAGLPADDFIPRFLRHTDYGPAIERYAPDLLDEVRGIAAGAGVDLDEVFAFQLLDEFILNVGDVVGHCSAIGVHGTHGKPALLGQNWDIESYVHGFQTVLHIKEDGSDVESLVFTYAGLIGAFGVNSRGVGICLNSLPILRYAQSGLPVAYVVRRVLALPTSRDALAFIRRVEHASPQNYLIGDSERIVDLECSAGKVVAFSVEGSPGIVYHTNHPLANDDYDQRYLNLLEDRQKGARTDEAYHHAVEFLEADSGARLSSLSEHLRDTSPEEVTVDRIQSILSSHDSLDHPVCMTLGDETKLASIVSAVMELSEEPRFHVAFGPPDVTPYRTYTFREDCS